METIYEHNEHTVCGGQIFIYSLNKQSEKMFFDSYFLAVILILLVNKVKCVQILFMSMLLWRLTVN